MKRCAARFGENVLDGGTADERMSRDIAIRTCDGDKRAYSDSGRGVHDRAYSLSLLSCTSNVCFREGIGLMSEQQLLRLCGSFMDIFAVNYWFGGVLGLAVIVCRCLVW